MSPPDTDPFKVPKRLLQRKITSLCKKPIGVFIVGIVSLVLLLIVFAPNLLAAKELYLLGNTKNEPTNGIESTPAPGNMIGEVNGETDSSSLSQSDGLISDLRNSCYTKDWLPITSENWDDLSSLLFIGSIATLPISPRKRDARFVYKSACLGSSVFSIEFIPRESLFVNLNIYYNQWFRWEFGGQDRRSIRLFRNADGCTTMKRVSSVTENFLPKHDSVSVDMPVMLTVSTYLSGRGKIRTQFDIRYYSEKTGVESELTGRYYYDFEADDSCNAGFPDINRDYYGIYSVGLMPQKAQIKYDSEGNVIRPKVEFLRFLLAPYRAK